MHDKKRTEFPGVPDVVIEHYQKKLRGVVRERTFSNCTVITTIKEWSKEDEDAMQRILKLPETWSQISFMFPSKTDQILLFEAAWQARIDYSRYRFATAGKGARRKNKARELASNNIKKKAKELIVLLDELSALGYRSCRNSNANLSEGIRDELSFLIEKTGNFDANYVCEYEFINAAISSQKPCAKREYLRAFLYILTKEVKVAINTNMTYIILDIGNAALGDKEDPIEYDDAFKIIATY